MKIILLFILLFSFQTFACPFSEHSTYTMATPSDIQKLAKAILELHDLYISTGEANKPMTISLPDLAEMAGLSKETTEEATIALIQDKVIRVEKSAIIILNKGKLEKIAGL